MGEPLAPSRRRISPELQARLGVRLLRRRAGASPRSFRLGRGVVLCQRVGASPRSSRPGWARASSIQWPTSGVGPALMLTASRRCCRVLGGAARAQPPPPTASGPGCASPSAGAGGPLSELPLICPSCCHLQATTAVLQLLRSPPHHQRLSPAAVAPRCHDYCRSRSRPWTTRRRSFRPHRGVPDDACF